MPSAARVFEESDLEFIIADDPTPFEVEITEVPDKVRGRKGAVHLFGPYAGSLAEFKQSRIFPLFDQKGTSAEHGFVLVALDLPATVLVSSVSTPLIDLGRYLLINNRRYKITSVPEVYGRITEVNIDLEQ